MADEANNATTTGTAVAVQPRRQVLVTEDPIPIFDTAKFEHYGRIAAVMANASLIPDALKGASRDEAVGNCFLITSLADRIGADPFMLAQVASVVYGRLMIEGKAYAAALKAKLHVTLYHHFTGTPGQDDYRIYVWDKSFDPVEGHITEKQLAKLKPGLPLPGQRMIDGCVGDWKTFEKDRTTVNYNWRQPQQQFMQLGYRGDRVWSRAYEPGVMMGIYADDEMLDLTERADRRLPAPKADLVARLTAGQGQGEGFSPAHVASETAQPAQEAEEVDDTASTGETDEHDADGVVKETKDEVVRVDAGDGSAPAWPVLANVDGPAPRGEVYTLQDDPVEDDDTVAKYLDGVQIGYADEAESAEYNSYEEHALTDEEFKAAGPFDPAFDDAATEGDEAFPGDHAAPTIGHATTNAGETQPLAGDAQTSATNATTVDDDWEVLKDVDGPAPLGVVYLMAGDLPLVSEGNVYKLPTYRDGVSFSTCARKKAAELTRYTHHAVAASGVQGEAIVRESQSGGTAAKKAPGVLDVAMAEMLAMDSWLVVKPRLGKVYVTDEWKALAPDKQRRFRLKVHEHVKAKRDPVQESADPSFFRLWLETQVGKGKPGGEAIDKTLRALKSAPAYAKMGEANQQTIIDTAAAYALAEMGA